MTGRICQECSREILPEMVAFDGLEDAVDIAGEEFPEVDETDFERAEIESTIRISCSCSYHDIEVSGSVSAFNYLPEAWDYDRNVGAGGGRNE